MNILVLQKYNNYFNRIIKKLSTVADYRNADGVNYTDVLNINFNPADGVTTELILGKGLGAAGDENWYDESDYLVVYTSDEATPPTEVIVSRWFIVEAVRTRGGQHKLTLKRDVIADNLNSLLSCPAFIQRGTVNDDNPLILNDEGMAFNEIKTSELLLKDNSNSAWLVAYTAKSQTLTDANLQAITQDPEYLTASQIATKMGVTNEDFNKILDGTLNHYVNSRIQFSIAVDNTQLQPVVWVNADENFNVLNQDALNAYFRTKNDCFGRFQYGSGFYNLSSTAALFADKYNLNKSGIKSEWSSISGQPYLSNNSYNVLSKIASDKTIVLINGTYKQIKLTAKSIVDQTKKVVAGSGTALYSFVNSFITDYNSNPSANQIQNVDYTKGKVYVLYTEVEFEISLEDADLADVDLTISASRNECEDAIYDIITMPYNNVVVNGNGYTMETFTGANNLKLMQSLAVKNDGKIYDIQLLPYCPIVQVNTDGSFIDLDSLTQGVDYDFINQDVPTNYHEYEVPRNAWTVQPEGTYVRNTMHYQPTITGDIQSYSLRIEYTDPEYEGTIVGTPTITNYGSNSNPDLYVTVQCSDLYVSTGAIKVFICYTDESPDVNKPVSICLYPKKASFAQNLNYNLELKDEMKVESQCNKYRLVSPNYQGSFDFSVAKNGGICTGFVAECTYKPYTPYIKVTPNFGWMYGGNYGDARGLILGGDFSLGRISSAWESYQLQNKNYQNIFNRDIQNLDVSQDIARRQNYITSSLSVVNTAGQGALTGAMAGGGYGAIAGAAAGALASGTGFALDAPMFEKSLHEQRQYAIDKFNYQLGNIKALPYTITKVGAFDINSKIWPFLEYYTCTDTEKEILRNKIIYQGMTVMAIDTLDKYLTGEGHFTKAELIRNDTIKINNHELNEIYNELIKGVYL